MKRFFLNNRDYILKRALPAAAAILVLAVVIIAVNLNAPADTSINDGSSAERGIVTEVLGGQVAKNEYGVYTGSQTVSVEITSGDKKGQIIEASNTADQYSGVICEVGTHVVVAISETDDTTYSFVSGYDHSLTYIAICILFAVIMVIVAGVKGLKALLGLIVTVATLVWLLVPLLCYGLSPYLTSIVWAVITTIVTIILISGISVKSVAAVAATTIGVTVSGVIASVFGMAAHITGYNMLYAEELVLLNGVTVQVGGLLFAGILIASLGAVMDVCMSIASAVNEIYAANPNTTRRALFKAGMTVGKDTMGTMANTLILAFAGSSLTMIVLLYAYKANINYFVSMNDIAIEIIQGVAGSIGICLCVPTVSFISSNLAFIGNKDKKAKKAKAR